MNELRRMDRRQAIKWMLTAAAAASVVEAGGFAVKPGPPGGYGTDPDLLKEYKAGDFWPLTLDAGQRRTTAALCDVIIPADNKSPTASQLNVHDFIDEWISAPYPKQKEDRALVLKGLEWLDKESRKRFKKPFADLTDLEQRKICDDICYLPKAGHAYKLGAEFFARFRDLAASGFYTTAEGMKDIQYIGNVALMKFDGPPPEVLAHLKLL